MLSNPEPAGRAGALIPGQCLGVPCYEAQADGLPCTQLGVDCADCARARPADASVNGRWTTSSSTHA